MLTKDVVDVVYGLRKQRKLNCEQVGKVLGYKTGKGYRDIEIGRVELTVNHVLKLSEFYQVPIGIFFAPKHSEMESEMAI